MLAFALVVFLVEPTPGHAVGLERSESAYVAWAHQTGHRVVITTVDYMSIINTSGYRLDWVAIAKLGCALEPDASGELHGERCRFLRYHEPKRIDFDIDELARQARLVTWIGGQRQVVRWKLYNPVPWPAMSHELCPYPGGIGIGMSGAATAAGKVLGDSYHTEQSEAGQLSWGTGPTTCH